MAAVLAWPTEPKRRKAGRELIVMLFVQRVRDRLGPIADEDGQAMVEYALLVSLVAVATAVAVQSFGAGVAALYSHIQAVYP